MKFRYWFLIFIATCGAIYIFLNMLWTAIVFSSEPRTTHIVFDEPISKCVGITFANEGHPFKADEKESLTLRFLKLGQNACLTMKQCKKCKPLKFEDGE